MNTGRKIEMEYLSVTQLNTPCYIYDENILYNRIRYIKKQLGINYRLCYSMKANPWLLPYVKDHVDRIEVCSHGEFYICKECGIIPEQIIYTGVNKQKNEINEAILYGIRCFNVESLCNLEFIQDAAETNDVIVNLYFRLSSGNQFGMSEDDVLKAFDIAQKNKHLNVKGLHFFAGTFIKNKKRLIQLSFLRNMITRFRELIEHNQIEIEYGPGLPVRYFLDEDYDLSEKAMEEFINDLKATENNEDESWTIEMGRYIAADCGSYMTTVEDIKENSGVKYVIVDGGINHLNYYGQTMSLRVPIIESLTKKLGSIHKYWICGSLCTTADVLVKDAMLPELDFGDKLLFHNCGAYSNTESNYLFLSRDMPYVYLRKNDGNIRLLRSKKPTYKLNKEDL